MKMKKTVLRNQTKQEFMKPTWVVALFTAFYLMVSLIVAIMTGCNEFILYLALTPFLMAGMVFTHIKIKLPLSLMWALSFLILFHCFGGLTWVPESWPTEGKNLLYNLWLIPNKLKYDQVIHAYGNALATWLCWNLLRYSIAMSVKIDIKDIPARPIFLLICFLAGVGVGALNETLEFGATQTVPGDTNVGGYVNTGWDMVANILGGGVTVFCIWLNRRNGRLPSHPKKARRSHA